MAEFSDITEFKEIVEFTPPESEPKSTPEPTEWDGWGDEEDRLRFEQTHKLATPLGGVANHQIVKSDFEYDGWGNEPSPTK